MSGFFSGLQKEASLIARDISRGVDDVSRNLGLSSSPTLNLFLSGNVLQFVSRSSSKALQIVANPAGQLVLDGMGPPDAQAFNTHWTVLNEGNRIVRLHNNNNYIAIANGTALVVSPGSPAAAGAETKLRLVVKDKFIMFESTVSPGHHLGVLPAGYLKSAAACGRDMDSQFGVVLIHSPYSTAQQPK